MKFKMLRLLALILQCCKNKQEGKVVFLCDGTKVRKPLGLRNNPHIQYTILPKERISYQDWYYRLLSYSWTKEDEVNPEKTTLKVFIL